MIRPTVRSYGWAPLLLLGAVALAGCGTGGTVRDADAAADRARAADSADAVTDAGPLYAEITAEALYAMLAADDVVLVNVHIPYDGDIPGTDARIPFDEMEANLDKLPADRAASIVLYCRSGHMSALASASLISLGYTNVVNLVGGMQAWSAAGYPLKSRGEGG